MKMNRVLVAPSLLAADFSQLGREVERVQGADMLHLDIMDGCFVPNISFGPAVVAALRGKTGLSFDVHLMLEHPLQYLEPFQKAGADSISFHIECGDDPAQVLRAIRELGVKPALAISPGTPVEALLPFLDQAEMVTVMTVEPGFGGQKLMPEQLEKVRWLRAQYPGLHIEVDGGVTRENAGLVREAGADILVAGTAVFKAEDPEKAMTELRG